MDLYMSEAEVYEGIKNGSITLEDFRIWQSAVTSEAYEKGVIKGLHASSRFGK